MFDWLIVGAGFAGSVLAERLASQRGDRVLVIDKRNHIGGNTGSSTFRFALASLLLTTLRLHPRRRTKKFVLDGEENARLRGWQETNLKLTWCERPNPWEIEGDVIATMKPPLNAAGNSAHPFYPTLKASRAAFRAAATPTE